MPTDILAVVLLRGGNIGMAGLVSLIEAAMPPMIGAGIVATQAGWDEFSVDTLHLASPASGCR